MEKAKKRGKTMEKLQEDNELTSVSRRGKIEEILKDKLQVTVKDMASRFGVSEMTIRRDFHKMEEQGIVTVHYGGAKLKHADFAGMDFLSRQDKLYQNKLQIAKMAAGYVKEGDVLFLDTSTTILLMLRYLPDMNLTIVTNSLPVMEETYRNRKIRLYVAPGFYQEQYGGPLDYSTAEYVSRFHYDKAFFGASAVDVKFGVSATQEIESAAKQCAWKNADERYLLVDHTKFGKKNLIKYNDVSEFEKIFTDEETDFQIRQEIARAGGNLVICE